MANPTSSHKSCPWCSRQCEKFIMFHLTWYWRCKECKIDADNPPPVSKGTIEPLKTKLWDDEDTQPKYKNPFSMYKTDTFVFLPNDCQITNIMMTQNHSNGMVDVELKVEAKGSKNQSPGFAEIFQEHFTVSQTNMGTENEMWEEISRDIVKLPFALNHDEIKSEYLKLRLMQRYPGASVRTV